MHSIRSRMRHTAWNPEDPPPYSYLNPFQRNYEYNRSRHGPTDVETGQMPRPSMNQSEPYINRAPQSHPTDGFTGPHHANTAPAASRSSQDPDSPRSKPNPPLIDQSIETQAISTSSQLPNGDPPAKPPHRFIIPRPILSKLPGVRKLETDDEKIARRDSSNFHQEKKKFGFWPQVKAIFGSWINIVLICVPVGIALNYTNVDPVAIFVVNFLAIMPLAGLLSYATEELALRVGETLGGLLNASFGNAVELIVSIIALAKDDIIIVQTSLIGSILSNLLLVMGMCFFFGGLKREQQHFNITVAQTAASLLSLAMGALIIPTVFHRWGTSSSPKYRESKVPALSRGTAVILLVVYACYLFFQLKTHKTMYNEPSQKTPKRKSSKDKEGRLAESIAVTGAGSAAQAGRSVNDNIFTTNPDEQPEKEDDQEEAQISVTAAVLTLCISTALIGITSEFMVDSIGALVTMGHISPEFVGLILIPIVGNAAEHATAVTCAVKDKMDLAIGVAVGSSMQIALLVLPLVVVIGWIIGRNDMTLEFDGFLLALLFISVLLVNYLIGDGRSHWLEGVMLMTLYVIIALAAWYYPASAKSVIG